MNNKPIGILDSGIGGLSIWRQLVKELPNESTIYFADSKNCPYGPRTLNEINFLAEKVVTFLIKQDVKLILIACNTITVSVINRLRKKINIPFVGVEPATKVAVEKTKTGNIGILATEGTFRGDLYNETKEKFAGDTNIHIQTGNGLVEMVETDSINKAGSEKLLTRYVNFFIDKKVDQVALGCTHYPFLKTKLMEISGNKINFIDPAQAVVKQLQKILEAEKIYSDKDVKGSHKIYSSGKIVNPENLIPEIEQYSPLIIENYEL